MILEINFSDKSCVGIAIGTETMARVTGGTYVKKQLKNRIRITVQYDL